MNERHRVAFSFPVMLRVAACALYLTSLVMVPYTTQEQSMEMRGVEILMVGWGALPTVLAWLANPLAIFSLICMRRWPVLCIALSVLGLGLAVDFQSIASLGWDSSRDVEMGTVTAVNTGAYVWLCSLVLIAMASIACALDHYLKSLPTGRGRT